MRLPSWSAARLNRTFVELKLSNLSIHQSAGASLNRTFVELKHAGWWLCHRNAPVLIEPLWN